jgi:hypothetical protein
MVSLNPSASHQSHSGDEQNRQRPFHLYPP